MTGKTGQVVGNAEHVNRHAGENKSKETTMETRSFDPNKHLMKIKGKDYLPVSGRLMWLDATVERYTIDTELVSITDDSAIARATVTIFNTDGEVVRRGTDYKAENVRGFPDFLEKCVTGAVGRALAQVGMGTQFATELADEVTQDRPVDAPRQERSRDAPRSSANQTGAPSVESVDMDSWSSFWPWARGLGFKDKAAVEQAIGRAMDGLSPAQLRDLLGKADAPAGEPRPALAMTESHLTDKQRDALAGSEARDQVALDIHASRDYTA